MGKPWALKKEEKGEEAWPNLYEKNPQGAQKETGLGYLGAARTNKGILGKCQKESTGKWTAQGSMLMDILNKERHVASTATQKKRLWKQMMTQEPKPDEGKPGILRRATSEP